MAGAPVRDGPAACERVAAGALARLARCPVARRLPARWRPSNGPAADADACSCVVAVTDGRRGRGDARVAAACVVVVGVPCTVSNRYLNQPLFVVEPFSSIVDVIAP